MAEIHHLRRHELRWVEAEVMRADSGDWSSSTMAIGALCSVSGMAVAAVYTEAVKV
jgi:hypothetical protein